MKPVHLFILFGLAPTLPACSGNSVNNLGSLSVGGQPGVGGQVVTGGSSEQQLTAGAAGDTPASSGPSAAGTTGHDSMTATGGVTATGGNPSSGGAPASGGKANTGGALATAGHTGAGGYSTATGGTASTGGSTTITKPVLDLSCQSDSDCCVVLDECQVALYLVGVSQKAQMEAYLEAQAPRECTRCMAPNVQVACTDRQCTGTELGTNTSWPPTGLGATHCGELPVGSGGAPGAPSAPTPAPTFQPDPSAPATVFACGV